MLMVKCGEEVRLVSDKCNGPANLCFTVHWCSNWCPEDLEAVSSKGDAVPFITGIIAEDGGLSMGIEPA